MEKPNSLGKVSRGIFKMAGDRFGNWQPTRREIIVELVGIGKESFSDDGTSRRLRFDRVG